MIIISDQLLNESELMQKFEVGQRAKLREALSDLNIPFRILPNGKIFTTLSSINMGLHGYGSTKEASFNDGFA
ncbi:MAG: hypothetical protein JHC38_10740 [Thiotrichales bacterium]|jgi:hypothetical protein|nr:hypothetical protein [Thiotrichales bacterium]